MISLLDLRFISGRRNSNIDRTNVNEDKLTLTTCSDQTFGIMNESLFLDTLSVNRKQFMFLRTLLLGQHGQSVSNL